VPRNSDKRNLREKHTKISASKTIDSTCSLFLPSPLANNMELVSLEKALRSAGYHGKKLYPRHLEKTFKAVVKEGKVLRIHFKELV
jgi:hypothetical protein